MSDDDERPSTVRPPKHPAAKCEQENCEQRATHTYIWPGTGKRYAGCFEHAMAARRVVEAMGLELELLAVD